jgi:hypothetical protein
MLKEAQKSIGGRLVLEYEGPLMKDLILFFLLVQTMMIKIRKVFRELKNSRKPRYNPFIVHNFDGFMRQKSVRKRQHSKLMRFLSKYPQPISVR